MPITVACGCGKRFVLRDDQVGRPVPCPACGTPLAASGGPDDQAKPANPALPAGAPGAEALAALLNHSTPQGARNLAAALNAAGKRPAAATNRPHRFGTLGCAFPLGLLCVSGFVCMFVIPDGPPLAVRFGWAGLGAVLLLVSVWRMWGQWTKGRVAWCVCLVGVCAFFVFAAAMGSREQQQKEQDNQKLTAQYAPLVDALGDPALLQLGPTGAGLRPGVVVVVVKKKGEKKGDKPTPPEVQGEFNRALPDGLRASGPDDAQTIVLLNYGWSLWGTYRNQITGNTGGAYVGTCEVTVVDRNSRLVVAHDTLDSAEKPPSEKMTAMEWYGSQPSAEDVVEYLKGLPTRDGNVGSPTRPGSGSGSPLTRK